MTGIQPIDPRGPRFNAALTSLVLTAVLLTAHTGWGLVLLALQAAHFATAVVAGVTRTPAAFAFRTWIRPRLTAPDRWEDPRPVRFAQGIGLGFTLVALAGFLTGTAWLGYGAVGFALAAALLNATVNVCLGCWVYGVCQLPQDQYADTQLNSISNSTGEPAGDIKEKVNT